MNETRYYELWTSTTDLVVPSHAWSEQFDREHCCRECHIVLPGVSQIDVVVEKIRPQTDFSVVNCIFVGVMSRSLLDCFGEKVIERDLWVGRVMDESGREISSHVTVRGTHPVLIRGRNVAQYRRCDACGAHIYFPIDECHLIRTNLTGRAVYREHDGARLIVQEQIYQRISSRQWEDKHMQLDPLPVFDEPLDGLGDLPIGPFQH